ncbi:MAG: peptidylprolyl isomerase [Pyrinomonadaceae bacterium]|nr:peptidylprolyl isomerase [Pyrinomonadaceae bacterium]
MLRFTILIFVGLVSSMVTNAQVKPAGVKTRETETKIVKKANQRPAEIPKSVVEPFEKATVAEMAAQCVKFETDSGAIEMEMYPESAPESVRGFLNLAGSGALDTTTFSRVVPNFIIQGGDLFTNQKMTAELDKRARRLLPDEPNQIEHERGIVSMARADEPNSASTHFFILLSEARTLDGKFAAFGRVIKGIETVEAINKMPVEGEKPTKPVKINRAVVAPCERKIS